MQSDSIVIAFDVTEDFRAGFFDRLKDAVFNQFRLETGKETLGLGVILTVAFARHTLPQTILLQKTAKSARSILTSSVRMNNCAGFDQPFANGFLQGGND